MTGDLFACTECGAVYVQSRRPHTCRRERRLPLEILEIVAIILTVILLDALVVYGIVKLAGG